jgi:predicted  nucleic acid-binding Zn-ribbon protein
MSHESDLGGPVYVSDGDVKVEKSFVADEFPVPAIKFRVSSESETPVHVRIVDSIPGDFPMEGVGFHPDYESEHWTAYKDHRVEYERTLDARETVVTVYGVRLDNVSEAEAFLVEPVLERPPVPDEGEETDDGVEGILGEDRSQLVRDALQGNGSLADEAVDESETAADDESGSEGGEDPVEAALESIPDPAAEEDGVEPHAAEDDASEAADEEEPADFSLDDPSPVEPRPVADDATPALVPSDATADDEASDAAEYVDAADAAESDSPAEAESDAARAPAVDGSPEGGRVDGSLTAALAAEIREGSVPDEDLELIRAELDPGLPRSADVRIRRLQSQVEDLAAYSDALAAFIDDEGTGEEVIASLRDDVRAVSDELDRMAERVDAGADERESIRSDVSRLRGDLDALDERVEDAAQSLSDVEAAAEDNSTAVSDLRSGLADLSDRVDDVAEEASRAGAAVSDLDGELGDVREDIASLDGDIVEARAALERDVEALRGDLDELSTAIERIEELEATVEGLESFRHRLNDVFGAGARGAEGE